MLPRFHVSKRVLKRVSKHGFGLWFWGPNALRQLMPHLLSAKKLDRVIHQLTILREVWPRIDISSCIQALNAAADRIDDVVDDLRPGSAPVPGFTRREVTLLTMVLTGLLSVAFLLGGVHLGRYSCPAPNVARVGQ